MIPQKIEALFRFIDFLDNNKKSYIEKYIPICNELRELDKQRSLLKPNENYKDKQTYDSLQNQISEKFKPITENIYKPITNKLKELGIWLGDEVYTSIWNNNISDIIDFKRNFTDKDLEQIFEYKQKYISFRNETNDDFLCLSFVFSNIDEILKELFDFFKDTDKNEFDSFETKTIQVNNISDISESLRNHKGKNVRFSFPTESFENKNQKEPKTTQSEIKNELNIFNIGDKIKVGEISNKKGNIVVGNNNEISKNDEDQITKKSFNWQKREMIITIIIGIVGLIIAYLSLIK